MDLYRVYIKNLDFLVTADQFRAALDGLRLSENLTRIQIIRKGAYWPGKMCTIFASFGDEASANRCVQVLAGRRLCSRYPLEVPG